MNKIIDILKDKVEIIGVIVIIDRQEGYNCSVPVKSVITKTDVVKYRLNQLIDWIKIKSNIDWMIKIQIFTKSKYSNSIQNLNI